ncbi:hypothetical protein [Cohnella soli]|uniref:Transposase n=1 Tax=Cohnella soli TaxID=425005 RepID=A0ABW0HRI0_9BACL
MKSIQLSLFDLVGMMGKESISVYDLYDEFQSLSTHQRSYAGYGGDVRAERTVRDLISQGDYSYRQWSQKELSDQTCRDTLYELIVQLWCVKVNGKVSRDIYQNPRSPKVYTPAIDDNLFSRMPPEVQFLLPKEPVLLVSYMEHAGNEQRGYHVTYYCESKRAWFTTGRLYDYAKKKWCEGRTNKLCGEQFRADLENQWWTRSGFERAKADNRLDPQIAAVWSNYVKFYGRDEALCRLGLPPVSAGYDERHFEECDKYAYGQRKCDQSVHPRAGARRRTAR